jgi:hypothetical protein
MVRGKQSLKIWVTQAPLLSWSLTKTTIPTSLHILVAKAVNIGQRLASHNSDKRFYIFDGHILTIVTDPEKKEKTNTYYCDEYHFDTTLSMNRPKALHHLFASLSPCAIYRLPSAATSLVISAWLSTSTQLRSRTDPRSKQTRPARPLHRPTGTQKRSTILWLVSRFWYRMIYPRLVFFGGARAWPWLLLMSWVAKHQYQMY